MDWDAINSDELNSEDIDRLEAGGKLVTKKKTKKKGEGMNIKFSAGFGEDVGKKLMEQKQEKKKTEKMSEFEKYQLKKRDVKKAKKEQAHRAKEEKKKMANMSEKEIKEAEKKRESYRLLIGDAVDESDMEFDGDADDPRFAQ